MSTPGVAVIGVVVVRPRREHDVGVPLPDLADDLLAHVHGGHELAVVVVERFVFRDAEPPRRLLRPPRRRRGERAAAFGLVAGVAVGDGDELDLVAQRGPLGGGAAGLLVAVVGMGAEGDDAEWRRASAHGRRDKGIKASRA